MSPRLLFTLVLLLCGTSRLCAQSALEKELDDNYKKAGALIDKGKWTEALPFFQRAAELAPQVFGPDHPNTGSLTNGLGVNYSMAGRKAEAEKTLRIALAIREKSAKEGPLQLAQTLGNLASLLGDRGQFDDAEKLYQRCVEIENARLPPISPKRHQRMNDLARLYVQMGRHRDADSILRKCLAQQEESLGPDHPSLGETLNNLTATSIRVRNFTDAEVYVRRAVKIQEKSHAPDHPNLAFVYAQLGEVCLELGKAGEAEALFRRCVSLREKGLGKDHPFVARSLTKLAQVVMRKGAGAEPEVLLRRSVEIYEKTLGPNDLEISVPLLELAQWKERLGQLDEAESLVVRTVALLEAGLGKSHERLVPPLQTLGGMQLLHKRYDEAEKTFRRALGIVEKNLGPDDTATADILNDLARTYSRLDRLPEAEALQVRALEISRKKLPPTHRSINAQEHNLARLYERGQKYREATELLEGCLKRAEANEGKDGSGVGIILGTLASISMAQGKVEEAVAQYDRALEIEQLRLRDVFRFNSEATMFSYLTTRTGLLPTMISMAMADRGGPSAETACTWTLRMQGVVFDTVCRYRQARQLAPDPEFKKRLDEYLGLKQRLADSALSGPAGATAGQSKEQLDQLRTRLERLEGELNDAVSSRDQSFADPSAVTAANVRAKLPPKSAMVIFVNMAPRTFKVDRWGPARISAFVLKAGQKTAQLVDLGWTHEIDADIDALRKEFDDFQEKLKDCDTSKEAQELEKSQEPLYRKKSTKLYGKLIAPLKAALDGAELLYLATDGGLNRLPFEALADDSGKYLAESRQCVYLSSGRDLLRPDETPAKGSVVFAGPDFKVSSAERQAIAGTLIGKKEMVASRGSRGLQVRSAGWKPLPGAEAEAGDIRGILSGSKFGPVKTYTGAEAMEEVLKAMPPPRLLHLATHGFYLDQQKDAEIDDDAAGAGAARARLKKQDNPLLRSGIVLAGANTVGDEASTGDDGWVTAEEIALLNLHGTELVVLSACQTGLGEVKTGEGVFGLRRAFLYAGARSLLTSLFEVPDTETRELMQRFYQGLKAGETKSASLNAAQRAMIDRRRQSHGAAHPFYWASFVLIGDPK